MLRACTGVHLSARVSLPTCCCRCNSFFVSHSFTELPTIPSPTSQNVFFARTPSEKSREWTISRYYERGTYLGSVGREVSAVLTLIVVLTRRSRVRVMLTYDSGVSVVTWVEAVAEHLPLPRFSSLGKYPCSIELSPPTCASLTAVCCATPQAPTPDTHACRRGISCVSLSSCTSPTSVANSIQFFPVHEMIDVPEGDYSRCIAGHHGPFLLKTSGNNSSLLLLQRVCCCCTQFRP